MRRSVFKYLFLPLLALSLGVNIAFIAIRLLHTHPAPRDRGFAVPAGNDGDVPSALHREIGVTREQWRKIAPCVREFREKARAQRQKITTLRGQLIDLLMLPEPDKAAIRAKQEEILTGQRWMQNLVIEHLLLEKEHLSQDQGRKLLRYLREQCGHNSAAACGKGPGRVLDENTGNMPDNENGEPR